MLPPVIVLLRASVVVTEPLSVVPSVTLPALFCSSVVPVPVLWVVLAVPLMPVLDEFELDEFDPVVPVWLLVVVPAEPLLVVPDVTVPALFCSSVVPDPVVPVLVPVVDWLPVELVVVCAAADPAMSRTVANVASAFFIGVELISFYT